MIKLFLSGAVLCASSVSITQHSFTNSLQTGAFFPTKTNSNLPAHNGKGAHFGNHFDYVLGVGKLRLGVGGYAGQLLAFDVEGYKEKAQSIASKFRFPAERLRFKESPMKSTTLLMGPVADLQIKNIAAVLWAKGGYGINDPSGFAVTVQDQGAVSNIYTNQASEEKNNFAYSIGGGIRYNISSMLGLQLAANYLATKSELINYNYEREKGTQPFSFSVNSNFIQANLGLSVSIPARHQKEKRQAPTAWQNNRKEQDRTDNDTLIFIPQSLSVNRQTPNTSFGEKTLRPLNNYFTAFLYRGDDGLEVSQCSGNKTQGDPVPGLDVRLKNIHSNQSYLAHTNNDGSFGVKDIADGIYHATVANDTTVFAIVNASTSEDYRMVQDAADNCGGVVSYVLYAEDKMYAQVKGPRDAASGQASGKRLAPRDVATGQSSGKRTHHPLRVTNTDFNLNFNNIIRVDDQLYAEVITARDAGSGMATGRRSMPTGDLDGDGSPDRLVEKATSGVKQTMQTQVLVIDEDADDDGPEETSEAVLLVTNSDGSTQSYVLTPRDAASGQASGKRQHMAPRDVATGQASGKRQHTQAPRDLASGQASGKTALFDYNVKGPRDAASGQASGKRMHSAEGYQPWDNSDAEESAINNPLYQPGGNAGTNPLYEKRFAVQGSSGRDLELIVPTLLDMNNKAVLPGSKYDVEAAGYRITKSRSNIQNNRQATKTRSNIQNNRTATTALESDGRDEAEPATKATINTTRSNIKANIASIENIACNNGTCTINAIVEIDGINYGAAISGVLKTRHDTVKNSIGNIR